MNKEKITSNWRIRNSILKIILWGGMVLGLFNVGKISFTNSFFFDSSVLENNHISTGIWVPTLTMEVDPKEPNGNNGWYVSQPCVKFFSDLNDVTIYYFFVGEEGVTSPTTVGEGVCVLVPEGKYTIYAWAENNVNSDWSSQTISQSFKVDSQCPSVEITNPKDSEKLKGEIEIRGTVKDDNPHHYWLVIENEFGEKVAGPGVVNESQSFENKKLFNWKTQEFEDGKYTIKLEARDEAGNKCPNLAPVPEDPEIKEDSVDWIEVETNNQEHQKYQKGDILINEIMWMGSDISAQDEWIELYNTTDNEIDLKGWKLENIRKSLGNQNYRFPASLSIPARGFLILANNPQNSANTALGVVVDVSNANLDLNDIDHGKIILKDPEDQVIDEVDASDSWPAGEVELVGSDETYYRSMQRNEINLASWCTAKSEDLNNNIYWKTEGVNYGSPRAINICEQVDNSTDNLDNQEELINNDTGNNNQIAYLDQVVINEFLPNPVGSDDTLMPGGEWIELYNRSDKDEFDLNGWYFYDKQGKKLEISKSNSDNNNNLSDEGETIIQPKGFLVVYLNGKYSNGWLNNGSEDSLKLFSADGWQVDYYSYSGSNYEKLSPSAGRNNNNDYEGNGKSSIPEGKSFVRYPDGANNWIDPVPTPGKPNSNNNSLKVFQEFYEPLCFNKKGEPICDIEFMYLIGLLKKKDEKLEKEEAVKIFIEEDLSEEEQSNEQQKNDLKNQDNDIKKEKKEKILNDKEIADNNFNEIFSPTQQISNDLIINDNKNQFQDENAFKEKNKELLDEKNFIEDKQEKQTKEQLNDNQKISKENEKNFGNSNDKDPGESKKEIANLKDEEEELKKENRKDNNNDREKEKKNKENDNEKQENEIIDEGN